MRRAVITSVLALIGLTIWSFDRSARGCGDTALMLEAMAKNAVSEDSKTAESAIKLLRRFGPEGLKALLATHADAIKKRTDQEAIAASLAALKKSDDPEEKAWQRLRSALDEVS